MTRSELEHIIRAAGAISEDSEIVVIGSQSILAQFPDAPPELTISSEADVYPKNFPERSDLVDGSIGEGSMFHEQFGYYAQGVGEDTATLPRGWRERLVSIRGPATGNIAGLCLEVNDLAISKYIAGREKDLEFTRELARHGMTDENILRVRLRDTEVVPALRAAVTARIKADGRFRKS
jgi:hypothetical protein